jgi:putative tryptophan/tyrosine transport system substrate-binding protein
MKRRAFISLLGGAAAWPLAARAQQPAMPVIGFLNGASPEFYSGRLRAFRQGLSETGYIEGRNVAIEYRWAEERYDRLPSLAVDLVRHGVSVFAVTPSPAVLAAKAATATIPIVFLFGGDPVELGLVASLNRPGGNITGVTFLSVELGQKLLELLHELVPAATTFALLVNPANPGSAKPRDFQEAAGALALRILPLEASTGSEIDLAFATLVQQRADALLVPAENLFFNHRNQLVTLAARHAIPTIYAYREFPAASGLMSYGASLADAYRQQGLYVGKILRGAKPTDLRRKLWLEDGLARQGPRRGPIAARPL